MAGVVGAALTLALVLGLPGLAAAAAPKPKQAPKQAQAPRKPFEWVVPGMVAHVEVSGTQESLGIPMQLQSVTSSWRADELFRHFAGQFREQGFYIPPPSHQLVVHGAMSLTALDVDRDLSYTVLLRPGPDGKTTRVLLSTANVGKIRDPESTGTFAPVYPGAEQLVTSDVEAGRSLAYLTTATPEQLVTFYRESMRAAGWEEKRPGFYRKGNERIQVLARPREQGRISVIVMGGRLAPDEELSE